VSLQTSGAIRLSQIRSFFGGAGQLRTYYRGGSYVPSQIWTPPSGNDVYWIESEGTHEYLYSQAAQDNYFERQGISYRYSRGGSLSWTQTIQGGSSPFILPYGREPGYNEGYWLPLGESVIWLGASWGSYVGDYDGWSRYSLVDHNWRITQIAVQTPGFWTQVNKSLPSSGQISLKQFYGARKTL